MPKLLPFDVAVGCNANFQILGEKRGKCENSSLKPPKGTSLHQNVKIGQPWRPVGEVKKRKKEKRKESHKQ